IKCFCYNQLEVTNFRRKFTMPLVSMKDMLDKARKEGYAVGQYNVNNLEFAQGILMATQVENAPVILGVSEGAARYMSGMKTVVKMIEGLIEDLDITVPVARSEEHTSELQSRFDLVCRLLLEKKNHTALSNASYFCSYCVFGDLNGWSGLMSSCSARLSPVA